MAEAILQAAIAPLGTRMLRSVLASFVLNVVMAGSLFVGQSLLTHHLAPAEYAQFVVCISFISLVSLLADLGITPMLTRMFAEAEEAFVAGKAEDRRGLLLGSALALRCLMALLVCVVVQIVAPLLYPPPLYPGSMVTNIDILLLTLVLSSRLFVIRSVGESVLRSQGRLSLVALFSLIDAMVYAGLLYYGRSHNFTLHAIFWVYVLCNVPGFILLLGTLTAWLREDGIRLRIDARMVISLMRLAVPLSIGTACLTIHTQIDNLLLDKLSTPWQVAQFGATMRLNAAVAPISVVLAAVTAPELSRLLYRGDHGRSRRLTDLSLRMLLSVSGGLALFLTAASSSICIFVMGSQYAEASSLLTGAGWLLMPIFAATFLLEASIASGKYWAPAIYSGFLMVAVIVGDLLLIRSYGAMGALISKFSTVTVGCAGLIYILRSSTFLDLRLFLTGLRRLAIALGISFVVLRALEIEGVGEWVSGFLILVVYVAALHFVHVLRLDELLSFAHRIRTRSTQPGEVTE